MNFVDPDGNLGEVKNLSEMTEEERAKFAKNNPEAYNKMLMAETNKS
jgi:hypothetical protein